MVCLISQNQSLIAIESRQRQNGPSLPGSESQGDDQNVVEMLRVGGIAGLGGLSFARNR